MSVNVIMLLGRLGADPESRSTAGGTPVCNFRLATDEGRGEDKRTSWHTCVAFGKTAELVREYLRKGDQAHLQGRLQYREWEKDGQRRITAEIVVDRVTFVGGKSDRASNNGGGGYGYGGGAGYGR